LKKNNDKRKTKLPKNSSRSFYGINAKGKKVKIWLDEEEYHSLRQILKEQHLNNKKS